MQYINLPLSSMLTTAQKSKIEAERQKIDAGFTIRQVGIGDGIQFTSLPENYYFAIGQKLIDISKPWYLDHNPFVRRDVTAKIVTELWNYPSDGHKPYPWPRPRESVFMTNAEIHAGVYGIKRPVLNRPRLYRYEKDTKFESRDTILFHPHGKSHGSLPKQVIDHIVTKYKPSGHLLQIGAPSDPIVPGLQKIPTLNMWELAWHISKCRMFIGVDSGPSWIAACYPDVVIKKIRTKFQFGYCDPHDWVPMDVRNPHSFWDCQSLFKIYNITENDMGFTRSFREI